MTAPAHLTAPLVDVHEASVLEGRGKDWCVRLVYVGPNPENASGRSEKFWQAFGRGTGVVEVRWGRLGANGQSQDKNWHDALTRAEEKLRKGYAYDDGTGQQAAKVAARRVGGRPLSFAERLARASVQLATFDRFLNLAALHGLLPLDGVGVDAIGSLRALGHVVGDARLYVDRRGDCWLAGPSGPTGYVVASIPPQEAS